MRLLVGILVVLLSGCAESKPAMPDKERDEIIAQHPGLTKACIARLRDGTLPISELMQADCYQMSPPQHWRGLWNTGWEWTNFCPAPARECDTSADHGDIWLEYPGPKAGDGLYEIEFVGSRTKLPGRHGHLNQYDYLMVVDRMISIRKVGKGQR